jgi:hypothetical protein
MQRLLCTPLFKGAFSSTDQIGTRNLKLIEYIPIDFHVIHKAQNKTASS